MFVAFLGAFIHLLFGVAIIDIYFPSLVLHDLPSFPTPQPPPAKRLVLFLVDGLRADKFFELDPNGLTRVPFLRHVALSKGSWGISHTRTPTETYARLLAIIAGSYERIQSIAWDLKGDQVFHDTIFNQSDATWAWGKSDILPGFTKKDDNHKHIHLQIYSSEEENFAKADPSKLDSLVFKRFESFLADAQKNSSMIEKLNGDRIVFFLHLLGVDNTGHAHKPQSEAYADNIRLVDREVERCVQLIDQFFNYDGKSSFILTSDHGMSDWGSHGTGLPDETKTPLVAWGAGIRGPIGFGHPNNHYGLSEEWRLGSVKRSDVNQADIAPLMAVLIGANIPVNSVGTLPIDYLATDSSHKARALVANAQQVLAQFQAKKHTKQTQTLQPFFWEFKELSKEKQNELMEMVESFMKQKRYKETIQICLKLIDLAIKGIECYHQYDRIPLYLSVALGFVSWIIYVGLVIIRDHTALFRGSLETQRPGERKQGGTFTIWLSGLLIALATIWLLFTQSSPWIHYCYFLSPIFLWTLIALNWYVYREAKIYFYEKQNFPEMISVCTISVVALEVLDLKIYNFAIGTFVIQLLFTLVTTFMVLSFFYRKLLAFVFVIMAAWPLFTHIRDTGKLLILCWVVSCICLASFLFFPVVGRDSNYSLVTMSSWIMIFLTAFAASRLAFGLIRKTNSSARREPTHVLIVIGIQVSILMLCTYVIGQASESLSSKKVSFFCHAVAWTVLVTSFGLPLFGSSMMLTRLLNVAASLSAPFLLMSISYEGLFLNVLLIFLFLWLRLEHQLANTLIPLEDISFLSDWREQRRASALTFKDCWRAYSFLFFNILAFFGTGNIASLNSFEPTSVYFFQPYFRTPIFVFLVFIRTAIPFLIVSCFFRAVIVSIQASPRALYLLVLLASDVMALHFFFLVQDKGSSQGLGPLIEHYVIMMIIIILVMLFYSLAWLLTSFKPSIISFKRHRL